MNVLLDEDDEPVEGMPNMPRDPEKELAKREKMKAFLQPRMRPDHSAERPLENANADMAFIRLLQDSANQAGTIGGRTASSQPLATLQQSLMAQNQGQMNRMAQDRKDMMSNEDRRAKLMQYFDTQDRNQKNFDTSMDFKKGQAKQTQSNADRQYGLEQQKLEIERQKAAKDSVKNDPKQKLINEQTGQITKKVTDLSNVRSELASAVKQLKDPNLSEDDKIRVAQGIVKTINMTQGTSDAIGAEEVGRLASELESSLGAVGKGIMIGGGGGATTGAAIGGGLGSVAGGVGAVPGAALGGGIGAVGGGLMGGLGAAANEMGKPGGFRLGPDVPGFTSRAERALDKVDSTIGRQTRLQELVGEGKTVPEANAIIDSEEGASTAAVEEPLIQPREGRAVPSPDKMKILRYLKGKYGG